HAPEREQTQGREAEARDRQPDAKRGRPDGIDQGMPSRTGGGRSVATLRAEKVRTAVVFFERAQEDDVARQLLTFNDSCAAALRGLTRSAAGCRWAIEFWTKLQDMLIKYGAWYVAWHSRTTPLAAPRTPVGRSAHRSMGGGATP